MVKQNWLKTRRHLLLTILFVSVEILASGSTSFTTNPQTGSVTSARIVDLTVDSTHLLDGSITNEKIAANGINSSAINTGAITGDKIANATIGASQLSGVTGIIGQSSQTVTITTSMTATDIQTSIDNVNKYIPNGTTITFQFEDGTYTLNNPLTFAGYFGGGNIMIQGNVTTENSSNPSVLHTNQAVILDFSSGGTNGFQVYGNIVATTIKNLKIVGATATNPIYLIDMDNNPKAVYIRYCFLTGTSAANGSAFHSSFSRVFAGQNYVSNIFRGIFADKLSIFNSYNNSSTGTNPGYGIESVTAQVIRYDGTQPTGSIANTQSTNKGQIY